MYQSKPVTAVIVAAGVSRRMGFDKLLYEYKKRPIIAHTAKAFAVHPLVDEIIVVAGENRPAVAQALYGLPKLSAIVTGGVTRVASVAAGVAAITAKDGLVAITDGARPFVTAQLITEAIEVAAAVGGAAPAVPVKDTIKVARSDKKVADTPQRSTLFAVQTPQVFDLRMYRQALALLENQEVTDDCSVFEHAGYAVQLTQGDYANLKITTKEDLSTLEQEETAMRIGHGYDVHRLVKDRRLILGGVDIAHEMGLLGHSDADVLTHAVMDALLGAAALGDIGQHFPDTDPAYSGADSIALLRRVGGLLASCGWQVGNIDATILCQSPKLAPHIPAMRSNIAAALSMPDKDVSVKATTEEKLGFTGEKLGIAAHAVCLLHAR